MPYNYVLSLHRYRDLDSGQFVSQETIHAYTESMIQAGGNSTDTLTDLYFSGTISVDDYIGGLRAELKTTMIQEYMLGKGGRDQMTPRDWGYTGSMLRKQYDLMEGFKADLEANKQSEAQARNRARLYFEATGEAFERGNAASYGVYNLPAYPRDGSSICVNGCGCRWRFDVLPGEGNIDCYWEIDPLLENCPTCEDRAIAWYPIRIRGGVMQPFTDVRAEAHVHNH